MGQSIRWALVRSHGSLLLILIAAVVLAFVSSARVSRKAEQITEVEMRRGRAADEMEINYLGIGFATHAYLSDHDPVHLDRIRKDTDDFDRALAEYTRLATDDDTARWAERARAHFAGYTDRSRQLIENEDRAKLHLADFLDSQTRVLARVRAAEDGAVAGTRHPKGWVVPLTKLDERVEALARLLLELSHSPMPLGRAEVVKIGAACNRLLATLRESATTDADRAVLDPLAFLLQQCVRSATEVEGCVRTEHTLRAEKLRLRHEMDDLLDDEIQAATSTVQAQGVTDLAAMMQMNRWLLASLGALGLLVGLAVSYHAAGRVTRPVRQLVDATIGFGRGSSPGRCRRDRRGS